MIERAFKLWMESDEYDESETKEDDEMNIQITLSNGKEYALNIWSYNAVDRIFEEFVSESEEELSYILPPDLFVKSLDRNTITRAVQALLKDDALKEEWLCDDSSAYDF